MSASLGQACVMFFSRDTQKKLAEALHIQQPAIAKMEKRTDIYISTLRSHIEAMGGKLEILASFPDGTVQINNFSDLG